MAATGNSPTTASAVLPVTAQQAAAALAAEAYRGTKRSSVDGDRGGTP